MMNFDERPEFQKEFKQLGKKYRSLPEDLREFCKVVSATPLPLGNSKRFNIIEKVDAQTGPLFIVKARLSCKYLKKKPVLRIVYCYFEQEQRIEFIELYYKGDKENENRRRIDNYLESVRD